MRYGERTAKGIAEGEALLKERRRVKSNKKIIVGRKARGEVALFRASGEEDNKRRKWPLPLAE